MEFVGLKHYKEMFHNEVFSEVCLNTLIYGVLQVVLSTVFGFLIALAANSKRNRFKSFFKVSLFYPYILPWTVGAMIWMYLLHPTRGIVNALLNTRIQWLNSYDLTLYVLVFISVWKTVGFNFLLFFGYQSIPQELYEAYSLESGKSFGAIRHITIPMLGPTTFVAVLLAIVGKLRGSDLYHNRDGQAIPPIH
ncbi:MAG: sugar ABC transporter permease [Lachnospiraceae bacterium]